MYTCIGKVKNNNGDTELYHLVRKDTNKDDIVIAADDLKIQMVFNNIHIDNLKLSSNNRIIDRKI